jgi:hypothetical protein
METVQTQFLKIFDEAAVYHRWQNSYINETITWDNAAWNYQQFTADGITSGEVASEASLVLGVPCTATSEPAIRRALRNGHLILIEQYEFDIEPGQSAVPEAQRLIASYIGEVVGVRGSFTWLEVELGSTLAPVGVQIPPRTFSSYLIGVPCQLG